MKLLDVTKIGEKEIEYINQLTVKGMSQKDIVKYELGDGATPVEIEGHFKTFRSRMKRSDYSYNPDKKIYEFKEKPKKKSDKKTKEMEPKNDGEKREEVEQVKTPLVVKNSNEKGENLEPKTECKNETELFVSNEIEPVVEEESNEDNKKRGQYRKSSKSNPLAIISSVDIAILVCDCAGKKEDRIGTGVYVMQPIAEDFAKLEEALYYLHGYTLVDVALISASQHMKALEKSAVFERFTDIVRKQKAEGKGIRKKQTNVKLCKKSIEAIDELSRHFAFLNKSEIVNLCMYALSQSAQASFIKKEDVKNEK